MKKQWIIILIVGFMFISAKRPSPLKDEPLVLMTKKTPRKLTVLAPKPSSVIIKCAKSGLKVRYVYLFKLCKKRRFWFDKCKKERKHVNTLVYDAIANQYKVFSDSWEDGLPPVELVLSTLEDALKKVTAAENLSLSYIGYGRKDLLFKKGYYINVRVISECRGERSKAIAAATRVLTLGLTGGYRGDDTGWVKFIWKEQ
ncbi:MAG: DUF4390 domain-containing protein [Candidatus Dadabacteria bacterium]|nr:MAG: DUF4390 domain-containing protein [Candidatus Dadabacteria bacterium]